MAERASPQTLAAVRIGDTVIQRCRWGTMMFGRNDAVIGRSLALYGEFAEDAHQVLRHFVRPGDVAVDVGANIGTVALFLSAAVGAGGVVHAFEPVAETFHALCGNMALNARQNVKCVQAVIGRAEGDIDPPRLDFGTPANFGAVSLLGRGRGDVAVHALDGLDLPACQLLKIDVEGMEIDVLEGASGLLRRCRPVVYAENKPGPASARVIGFLAARGYGLYWHFARFFRPDNFRGRTRNVFGDLGDINMLCLPPGHPARPDLPPVDGPESDCRAAYGAWIARRHSRPAP